MGAFNVATEKNGICWQTAKCRRASKAEGFKLGMAKSVTSSSS
jgi:hypothetical protein